MSIVHTRIHSNIESINNYAEKLIVSYPTQFSGDTKEAIFARSHLRAMSGIYLGEALSCTISSINSIEVGADSLFSKLDDLMRQRMMLMLKIAEPVVEKTP